MTDHASVRPTIDNQRSAHPLTRAAAVGGLLAAMLAMGVAAPTLAHASETANDSVVSTEQQASITRTFYVYNLTSHPMKLTSVAARSGVVAGAPPEGHILQPGQMDAFDITFFFFADSNAYVHYSITGPSGYQVGTYDPVLHVENGIGVPSWRASTTGGFVWSGSGMNLTVMDPQNSTIEVPAGQGQRQADILRQLCQQSNQATCTFTPTGRDKIWGPKHEIWRSVVNNSDGPVTYTREVSDTTTITNSIGVDLTAGGSLFGVVESQITARYNHEWTVEHTETETLSIEVPPHSSAVVSAVEPLLRDTGDFTVKMGNTTWNLRGVFFDSYDNSRVGSWIIDPVDSASGQQTAPSQTIAMQ